MKNQWFLEPGYLDVASVPKRIKSYSTTTNQKYNTFAQKLHCLSGLRPVALGVAASVKLHFYRIVL